jgi:hypothetical protein
LTRSEAIVPTGKKEGRPKTAFLTSILLAGAAALLFIAHAAAAENPAMIGIDMSPGTTSTASIGSVDTCTQIQKGDGFDADVFVMNAQSLVQWELRVEYDPAIVSLDSADYEYLLTRSGGQVFPSLFEKEKPGRMFLAAADVSSPDSGSGVLARLHWTALSNGTSPISILPAPSSAGPRLVSAGGLPFGDSDGDGIWDGRVTGGKVAVGGSCGPSTPVITPPPADSGGTATPAPGDGGESGGNTSSNGDDSSASGGSQATAGNDSGGTPEPFVGNEQGGSGQQGGPAGDGSSNDIPRDSGQVSGDSASMALIIAGIFAGLALLVGATFLVSVRRGHDDV